MLILSNASIECDQPASLSRRKDANSQRLHRIEFAAHKSIKKEGC